MSKIDDIPKKEFFSVPDDYFENLPARVQARIADKRPASARVHLLRYTVRYALPVLLVAAAVFYYNTGTSNTEEILASIDTRELIEYLHETGMTTEEILENVEFTPEEIDALESEVNDPGFEDTGEPTF